MKSRNGFVSNSSSTSFTCGVSEKEALRVIHLLYEISYPNKERPLDDILDLWGIEEEATIHSIGDNSIPYDWWGIIERTLKATRGRY